MTLLPPRRLRPLLAASALLLLVSAGLVLFTDHHHLLAGTPTCVQRIHVYYDTDQDMQSAAAELTRDPAVAGASTETRAQAYARFKVVFKNQPDLQVRPEDLNASITMTLRPAAVAADFTNRVRQQTHPVGIQQFPCFVGPPKFPPPPPTR